MKDRYDEQGNEKPSELSRPISPEITRHEIPMDGVIVDTTTEPHSLNLYLHGIKIIIPVTEIIADQLRTKPRDFRLLLEIR